MSRLDSKQWSTTSYPYRPGEQPHSATSRAAAQSISDKKLGDLHRRVYAHLLHNDGATDEEGQRALDLAPNTYRPRRIELTAQGFVKDSGTTRPTLSGRSAAVWIVTDKGRAA